MARVSVAVEELDLRAWIDMRRLLDDLEQVRATDHRTLRNHAICEAFRASYHVRDHAELNTTTEGPIHNHKYSISVVE